MSNTIKAFLNTQPADNHILWALLFFLNFEVEPKQFNVDGPISEIDEDDLIVAVSLMESILGIDVPDSYLIENKSRSLRQLANEIRDLPLLTDAQFAMKLRESILSWQAIMNRN